MSQEREIQSLTNALASVNTAVVGVRHNGHIRVKIKHSNQVGNITLSASPSDHNVMRQRERQIRKELERIGVPNPMLFRWRKI